MATKTSTAPAATGDQPTATGDEQSVDTEVTPVPTVQDEGADLGKTNDELFHDAFADALGDTGATGAAPTPAPKAEAKPAKPAGAEPAVEDEPPASDEADLDTGDPAQATGKDEKVEGDATPAAATPAAAFDATAIGKAIAEAMKSGNSETADGKPADVKEPDPEPEPTLADFMTDEEKATVENYRSEWKDVNAATDILLRANVDLAKHQIINQVARALAPIVDNINETRVEQQLNVIRTAHPDYEDLVPKVKEWVAKSDELYRPALENVLKQGKTADIVRLFSAYKKANGVDESSASETSSSSAQATGGSVTPVVVKKKPPAAAVAATAAVTSQRDNRQAKDVNDFDGALAEALNQ